MSDIGNISTKNITKLDIIALEDDNTNSVILVLETGLAVFGLCTNILSFFVHMFGKETKDPKRFLFSLQTLTDALICCLLLFLLFLDSKSPRTSYVAGYLLNNQGLYIVLLNISMWFRILVAVMRYFNTCKPFTFHIHATSMDLRKVLMRRIYISSAAFLFYTLVFSQGYWYSNLTQSTKTFLPLAVINLVQNWLIPSLVLLSIYSIVCYKLRKNQSDRNEHKTTNTINHKREVNLMCNMIITTSMFIICHGYIYFHPVLHCFFPLSSNLPALVSVILPSIHPLVHAALSDVFRTDAMSLTRVVYI